MTLSRRPIVMLCAAIAAAIGAFAFAQSLMPKSVAAVNLNSAGVALRGYDPVGYFAAGKPLPGAKQFQSTWDGATYQFASALNKTAFDAEPARFAPRYGGFCAWAASQGYKADADPNVWKIVDGKLYVNYNADVGKTWESKQAEFIQAADKNWKNVQSLPRK